MIYPDLAKELIELKDKDLKVRRHLIEPGKLFNGYNPKMEEVHLSNSKQLHEIILQIGYPNIDKVGIEARLVSNATCHKFARFYEKLSRAC